MELRPLLFSGAGHLGPVQNPAVFVELVGKHLMRLREEHGS